MFIDIPALRLQYEILNKPLADLAATLGIPVTALEVEAKRAKWLQWFPEPDMSIDSGEIRTDDMCELAEDFVTRSKQRLSIYNIAKEILLAQKYFALETKIINEANAILDGADLDAKTVKALSSLYVDMTKTSVSNALASLSFGTDDSGLPTVVIRDMSGRKQSEQ